MTLLLDGVDFFFFQIKERKKTHLLPKKKYQILFVGIL